MEKIYLKYEDINFIVVGEYISGEAGTYDTAPSYGYFEIEEIYIGENCVDFMLNETTKKEISNLITEKYYGSIV